MVKTRSTTSSTTVSSIRTSTKSIRSSRSSSSSGSSIHQTRSTASSSSSIHSFASSHRSRTSVTSRSSATSAISYTRRSLPLVQRNRSPSNNKRYSLGRRKRSKEDEEEDDDTSVISGFSDKSSGSGFGVGGFGSEVTPQTKYDLRSTKEYVTECPRTCSLPSVCFANCEEIWELMCKMDLKYQRNPSLFKNHPILGPQMRSILIDWIMDVCEAYKMHRETLYLAIDYLDRYLAVQKNVPKSHLQLIGITCLFVAAKLEEIYPPKLKTFAYVTDGACSESEILDMELVLMKTLKWKLTPITCATWVNIYLQILAYRNGALICTRSGADFIRASICDREQRTSNVGLTKHLYDRLDYVRVIRLVDLAILDSNSLRYTYSTLSAAAIYHIKGRAATLRASGFNWEQLAPCVNWMAPAAMVLRRHDLPPVLPVIEDVSDESRHLVQSHCVSLDMLNDAEALATNKICSPLSRSEGGLLTPPSSGEKNGMHKRSRLI